MEKINILGTGAAMVTKCYNTCFTISNKNEYFLVDAGGGNGILGNLEKSNIAIESIHNMFISHNHNDHILGAIWIIRAVAQSILNKKYIGDFNIYCHESSVEALESISKYVLNKKFTTFFGDRIHFIKIHHECEYSILNRKTIFFDIKSKKDLQFGFTVQLENDKVLTFLGDEPYGEQLGKYSIDVDYLLHEAYCMYKDRDRFKPYDKHHATVKEACENGEKLNCKNLILYHTEDKNIKERKRLYIEEGRAYYKGNLYVPDDLDEIIL